MEVNTVEHKGVIRQFEVFPIERIICTMHLFVNLDGKTQGFSGEIGKELKNVNELTVVNFNQILILNYWK